MSAAVSNMEEVKTAPEFLITVMPDYGMGPYAWQKPASDTSTLIGICVATAVDGFETDEGATISSELQAGFADWTAQFEQFAEKPDFDWPAFHRAGLTLSGRLKQELGSNYRVSYHKPCEDPAREVNEFTEIAGDA